jgi:hypothetical protein
MAAKSGLSFHTGGVCVSAGGEAWLGHSRTFVLSLSRGWKKGAEPELARIRFADAAEFRGSCRFPGLFK